MSVNQPTQQTFLPAHALKNRGRDTAAFADPSSKYAVKLRPRETDNQDGPVRNRTVLCIDGGGMRGIVAASVAVQVEAAIKDRIKEKLVELLKNPEDAFKYYELVYQEITADGTMLDTYTPATKEDMLETMRKLVEVQEDIVVHLSDYFDVMAGTSTGSILASYFATKGGTAHKHLLQKANAMNIQQPTMYQKVVNSTPGYVLTAPVRLGSYLATATTRAVTGSEPTFDEMMVNGHAPERLREFLKCQEIKEFSHLTSGSAQAAQAVMVTAGEIIFGQPRGALNVMAKLADVAWSKYSDKPITAVLQMALGGADKPIKFKSDEESDGKLHSSLLITSLQIDKNRGVIFWGTPHTWKEEYRYHGYSVVHKSPEDTAKATEPIDISLEAMPCALMRHDSLCMASCEDDEAYQAMSEATSKKAGYKAMSMLESLKQKVADLQAQLSAELEATAQQQRRELVAQLLAKKQEKLKKYPLPADRWIDQKGALTVVHNTPDYEIWRVVRASTAAPTFFPAQHIEYQKDHVGVFVDGGMVANNPVQQALAFALMLEETKDAARGIGAIALQHTAVLSIGCGQAVAPIVLGKNAGQLGWATQLANVLMGPAQDTAIATSSHILTMFMRQFNLTDDNSNSSRLLRVQGTMYAGNEENKDKLFVERCDEDGLWTMKPSDEKCSPDALKALQTMDDASDWKTLLEIGQKIGRAYQQDIKDWVKDFVLPDAHPSGTHAHVCTTTTKAQTGKNNAEATEPGSGVDWKISTAVEAAASV